jgi:hypothetical protein
MTPEAQRIAIAEACGWRNVRKEPPFDKPWDAPLGTSPRATYSGEGFEKVPDYLRDLNAMNEAEKVLTNDDADSGSQWSYVQQLIHITKAESMEMHREVFIVSTATAAQRAEAFLRTLGKWEDAK